MLPNWAPNLHPLVVHFPIVFVLTAALLDWLDVVFGKPDWLRSTAIRLWAAGGVAAVFSYWTGTRAAATVFVPGMAHPMIEDHRVWALTTALFVGTFALVQVGTHVAGLARSRSIRVSLAVGGLVAALLVQQTAERGGRLVYEQGVGVVTAPRTR